MPDLYQISSALPLLTQYVKNFSKPSGQIMKSLIYYSILSLSMGSFGILKAQEYPSKPIHIVVPFAPGGGADVLMRPLSKKLNEI